MHGCQCSNWPRKSGFSEYCCGSMKRTRGMRRHRDPSWWPFLLLPRRTKKRPLNRLLNSLSPTHRRWPPRYRFRCRRRNPFPWKNRRPQPVARRRWFCWGATALAARLRRHRPNGSRQADAVRSAIARRFTFRAPARTSSECWIAGACPFAAATGATTAMWFLRDSGFPRICPPQRSGSSAPAAATPDAAKRCQPAIRP